MNKRILLLTCGLATALALSSCNTFVGLGRDVKGLGQGVENTAYGKTWYGNPRPNSRQQAPAQNTANVPQTIVQ